MVSDASGTIEILEQSKATPEVASVTITAASTVLARTIMSSRGARLIGIAVGTVTATIRGTATVAGSSTAHGSFSISDFFRGSDIPTITTATIPTPLITLIRIRTGTGNTATERMVMIPAFTINRITTTRADTITTINRTTTIRAETPQLLTINPP